MYEVHTGYQSTKANDDDFRGENEGKDFYEEDDQARVHHLTRTRRHQAKEGPEEAPKKEKVISTQEEHPVLR